MGYVLFFSFGKNLIVSPMKENQITFEGLPMAISSLAEEVMQIKALLLETSTNY